MDRPASGKLRIGFDKLRTGSVVLPRSGPFSVVSVSSVSSVSSVPPW